MDEHDNTGGRDELAEFVDAARDGDRAAFDELVRRTYVETYTLALRLTGHEEDARDVVQEAYLRAWKGLRRFRGDAQFSTWLYRITANAAYTSVNRRRRHRTVGLDEVADTVDTRPEASPELVAESGAGLDDLASALNRLPDGLREVVVLKDIYDLSHEAIAHETGISVAAAKVRLHRGRKRLRDLLYSSGDPLEVRTCSVSRSPSSCPRPSTPTCRSTRPSATTSNRACAARPSSPATVACCAASNSSAPSSSSPPPGSSPRPWPRSRKPSERQAIRSLLTGRRLAYAGAIGGALAAAGATAAAVLAHRARRRALVAH